MSAMENKKSILEIDAETEGMKAFKRGTKLIAYPAAVAGAAIGFDLGHDVINTTATMLAGGGIGLIVGGLCGAIGTAPYADKYESEIRAAQKKEKLRIQDEQRYNSFVTSACDVR